MDLVGSERNIAAVKKGFKAFASGDIETVMSLFDDVERVHPGRSTVSGTYHGKDEVRAYLGKLAEKSDSQVEPADRRG